MVAVSVIRGFVALNLGLAVAATYVPRAPAGTQFITGPCQSDADCASSCCGFNSGKCAGPVIAQTRDGGCGHGDAQPNNLAAQAIQGPGATLPGQKVTRAPAGTQFITGACQSDADCASSCCGFNTGKCAGPVIAQTRDGGCGHGDAQPNNLAAQAIQGPGATLPGQKVTRAPAGTQFITGACQSDADCASGCCGFNSGKCAGAVIAQTRDGGCGHGDAQPNNKAAQAIQGPNAILPGGKGNGVANGDGAAAAKGADAAGAATKAAGAPAAKGKQFITGPCSSDADCANGCCGFNTGKCAGAVVAQERDGGCGHGDAKPNDNAVKALQARALAGLL